MIFFLVKLHFETLLMAVPATNQPPFQVVCPLFITMGDLVQNLASIFICSSQLMRHPAIELLHEVYAMNNMTNGHDTNI